MNEIAEPKEDNAALLLRLLRLGFILGGTISIAIGLWMVIDPAGWYSLFPGYIKDFGPQNDHFIRDLGGWYAAGGALLLMAAGNPRRLGGVALVVNLISVGAHAAEHLAEVFTGAVGAKHLIIDAPGVLFPFIILVVMTWIWWNLQSKT
ncbi:MAG: hypothetical protein ABR507_00630 [Actinomycetota bacterium]|nr:hypothetical protein [Actinomycetota bacterium]